MAHDPQHEDLLQRSLLGEGEVTPSELEERLAACPECRADLALLQALDRKLRDAAVNERSDLDQARDAADARDEARFRASLNEALAARRAARKRRLAVVLLAAAAVLITALAWRSFSPSTVNDVEREPEVLLGGDVECVTPVGAVGAYDVFTWKGELPAQGHFELQLCILEDDGVGPCVKQVPYLQEPRWEPTAEEERALPARLYWEVRGVDDTSGQVVSTGHASAWR